MNRLPGPNPGFLCCGHGLLAAAFLLAMHIATRRAAAEPPEVSTVSMVTDRNAPVLIYGSSLGTNARVIFTQAEAQPATLEDFVRRVTAGSLGAGQPPEAGDPGWQKAAAGDEHILLATYPCEGAAVLRVRTEAGTSPPFVVNRPEIRGLSPRTTEQGGVVTVWGPNLGETMVLVGESTNFRALKGYPVSTDHSIGPERRFVRRLLIPGDLPPGDYAAYSTTGFNSVNCSRSAPLKVVIPAKPRSTIKYVRDFGARGDGLHDDTDAILKAIAQAAAAGGGVVFLDAGRYAVSRTLDLPPGVDLEGVSRDASVIEASRWSEFKPTLAYGRQPSVVLLRPGTRVENLAFDLTYSRGVRPSSAEGIATLCVVNGPKVSGPAIRNCRIRSENEALYGAYPDRIVVTGCSVWAQTEDLVFENNEVLVTGLALEIPASALAARICRNLFRQPSPHSHNSAVSLATHREALIEGNRWVNTGRAVTQQSHNSFRWTVCHNLYLHNIFENCRKSDGEIIYYEMGQTAWSGRVQEVRGASLRLADAPDLARVAPSIHPADNLLPHHLLFVSEGRGLGQFREITRTDGATLQLDRPWVSAPDSNSLCVIIAGGALENLHVGNEYFLSHQWVGIYGSGVRNAWVNETYESVSGGTDLWKTHGIRQMSLNLVYANKYHERAGVALANDRYQGGETAQVQVFGNEIRNCAVEGRSYASTENGQMPPRLLGQARTGKSNGLCPLPGAEPGIAIFDLLGHPEMGPADTPAATGKLPVSTRWNLLYANQIVRCPIGIQIGGAVGNTLLLQNVFFLCPTPILDQGRRTLSQGNEFRGPYSNELSR